MDASRSLLPIASERTGDPALDARLDAFVLELGSRVDELQDLEAEARFPELHDQLQAFAAEARELGYPLLVEAAERVALACRERSADAVRKSLIDLTELSQRVRSGHRGAA